MNHQRNAARTREYDLAEAGVCVHVIQKNIKNMYLKVRKPDGRVELSAPLGVTETQLRSLIRERAEWIRDAQARLKKAGPAGERGSAAPQKDNASKETPAQERENRKRLQLQLEQLIAAYEPRMGVRSAGFTIKKMKTRWGSCNVRTGHLNFNYALCRLPNRYVEYVVVHELTHLLEPSHNARFHALTEHFLPGADRLQKELRQLGRQMNLE